jgi:hypothetical protein
MTDKFEQWALLEIMGHQRYAGMVSEQSIGGASFVRVDVPECGPKNPAFTKLFGANSIYAITPVTEEVAKMTAQKLKQAPISVYDLPEEIRDRINRPLIASHAVADLDDYDDEEDLIDSEEHDDSDEPY